MTLRLEHLGYNMKKQFMLVIFFLIPFSNCEHDFSPLEPYEKFFHPKNLSKLALDHVGNFWVNDSIKNVSDYVTANFDLHPNHLSSIRYSGKTGNVLEVSVFKSQEIAIEAIEERIPEVAALIFPGDSYGDWDKDIYEWYIDQFWSKDTQKRIKDKWWWGIYGFGVQQRYIFVNKWNTIIGAVNYQDDLSDSARLHIEDAAIEIAKRVDVLSEVLN